jgi:hypothetical protein
MASQRSRGDEPAVKGRARAARPAWTQIAPGVATVTTPSGDSLMIRADGSIVLDDVLTAYGSTERYLGELAMQSVPSAEAPDGARVYANGAIGWFRDLVGSSGPQPPLRTIEDHQKDVPWIEAGSEGARMVIFADGAVMVGHGEEYLRSAGRSTIPSMQIGADTVWADGAIRLE